MTLTIGRIQGFTREIGKSQGFMGLPLRDGIMTASVDYAGRPNQLCVMAESAWHVETADAVRLLNGEPLILRILGPTVIDVNNLPLTSHPAVLLYVGDHNSPT